MDEDWKITALTELNCFRAIPWSRAIRPMYRSWKSTEITTSQRLVHLSMSIKEWKLKSFNDGEDAWRCAIE